MKKSLIIRWAVILVIVIGWTLSIFPMKDKDFLVEFNNRAKKSVAALQKKAERAEVLKEKLDGIADKNSQEYLSVSKDLAATAANTGISASQALDEWKELNRRIDCLREGKDLDGNPVEFAATPMRTGSPFPPTSWWRWPLTETMRATGPSAWPISSPSRM